MFDSHEVPLFRHSRMSFPLKTSILHSLPCSLDVLFVYANVFEAEVAPVGAHARVEALAERA